MTSDNPNIIHIDFGGRRHMENRWTRYRAAKLEEIGFSEWETMALKYNKMTNPRVAQLYKDVKAEVKRIQEEHELPSYEAAAKYRREHFAALVDSGEIEEYDPYIRMGYYD